jgi:hypothetical protein
MDPTQKQKDEELHLIILKRTYELITSAFTFVAALAWNEAIQSLFQKLFGTASSLAAKFLYAVLLTVIIVYLGTRLAKISSLVEKKLKPAQGDSTDNGQA